MTKIFFVRHAQPVHSWNDDRTRPLTKDGLKDVSKVVDFFKTRHIDCVYSSPYTRSIQTIESTANYFGKEIMIDERLREREKGMEGNHHGMFQKRWSDKDFHEDGGESIHMVQDRNIAALTDILRSNEGKIIVIGTHGTALSSILNYYDSTFNCESFLRIIDWMPYIIELNFEGAKYMGKMEHFYMIKEFQGIVRSDKNDLLNIKSHYDLSDAELSKLFHIPANIVEQYLQGDCKMDDKQREQTLSTEIAAISMYHTQSIDFRIKSYLDELYARHQIDSTILSKLTGMEEQQIDVFTKDPASASAEVK